MSKIDNFELIKTFLKFENEDDFYFIQIIKRRKENKEMSSNSKVIKNYYVSNLEYLERKKEEIIGLCKFFNARATIRLNKRSYKKCAWKTLSLISEKMSFDEFKSVKSTYDKAVGKTSIGKNKTWILDLDEEHLNYVKEIKDLLQKESIKPIGDKFVGTIPSKSGFHIISKPFDTVEFRNILRSLNIPGMEIHKDNPTNLYIPCTTNDC